MIDIQKWMDAFLVALDQTFGERIWFVGLQGSYGRGEATEQSDIDVVVILDQVSAPDITSYNAMLDSLSHRELTCGFFSGKEELMNWEPSDLFQLCHDTIPIRGSMEEVLALIDEEAVRRAIKLGACNIYHGCVHNMLHRKGVDTLYQLYKCASFVVQAIVFRQTGTYIKHLDRLLPVAASGERAVIETFLAMKNGQAVDFETASRALFAWAKEWVTNC